ncbi:MAG: PQQ-binding-like beta-propeller repeat protein [Bacteroidales bacterium]|nr:PQQ-binding-like beta-propeller repeat protein [Bacteroidales bacterium]
MKRLLILPLLILALTNPVRFAFITDTHLALGSHSFSDLRRCIADINAQDSIDFVIFGGDITDFGTDEEISAAKQLLDSLRQPWWVVAGNHDAKWSESGCNTFKNVFGYEHFEFEAGGWRFLGCNCGPDMRMAPALLPRESMEWLESLPEGVPSIFINHYPQDTSVLNYFDVTRALKKAGVRFEIGGHWHQNRVLNYDGIPAVLGRSSLSDKQGCTGYNIFRLWPDSVAVCERRLHPERLAEMVPWYSAALPELRDTVQYDAHGLPASYPWLRYEVNERYPQVREVWKFQESSNIVAGFARKGRRAWYTTASGSVCCIRVRDGKRLWAKDFPGKIFSTPAVSGGTLVFGCTDGNIYALNTRNGRIRWSSAADKSVLASPVVRHGTVYAGASDGVFRALDLRTGATLWEYSGVEGFVECRPMVDDEQIVFGSWTGRLYSLDPRDGSLQWIWRCSKPSRMYSPAATWPVKAAGRIFIANPDRKVYAIDARSGRELFSVDGGREAIGLSSDGSTVLAKTMFNSSYAFRADVEIPENGVLPDSALLWKVPNGTHYEIGPTPLVESGGMVLTPTDKGNLFALSLQDGSLQWIHKISVALINPLEVWTRCGRTYILASAMDGNVTLLELRSK